MEKLMIFRDISDVYFTLLFLIFTAVIAGVGLVIFQFLKREKNPRDFAKNELFLKISEDFQKKLEELINQEIEKNLLELKKGLQKTSEEIIKNYKTQFENTNQKIKILLSELNQAAAKEISKIQETNLKAHVLLISRVKKESEELSKELSQKFSQIYQSTKETLNTKINKTEEEIENYKKGRFREIDKKIYQMVGEVAKKTIGKTTDLSDHEKLVMTALEKAKKEIF